MIKSSTIVKIIKRLRKSISTNVNATEITSCLEDLVW